MTCLDVQEHKHTLSIDVFASQLQHIGFNNRVEKLGKENILDLVVEKARNQTEKSDKVMALEAKPLHV